MVWGGEGRYDNLAVIGPLAIGVTLGQFPQRYSRGAGSMPLLIC